MKRTQLLIAMVLGLFLTSTAGPVDLQTAQFIAAKFMGTNDLQLVDSYPISNGAVAFYIFNASDGFVIVAADDCETPIIGYSHEGRFDPDNIPVQMEDCLQDFVARMQYGIENHIEADEITARQWELVKATGSLSESKTANAVAPLLTANWHQGCLYNSLCPTMNGSCDHAVVGCVAVAMGQIMHYWKYPTTGWGSHSYTNSGATFSADFGNTTYDWDHMPDSLTEASTEADIEAVATLLYHCGVSVDMHYTINGSSASINDVPNALRRYFNYSRLAHKEKKSNYNNEEWLAMLKHDLDLQRPVFYSGSGSQGGHSFVCDGYDDNDLLHFNWGWGTANGYFALGNLNPNGYAFNNSNYAIFDIIPQYEPCLVVATAQPSTAGAIEGSGEYHIGEQCTLTAISTDDYWFYRWKKNGQVISNNPSYTFSVKEDTANYEAHFSLYPVSEITASYSPEAGNPNSNSIELTWSRADTEWKLLKQFETIEECSGVATDGEHIYVNYAFWNQPTFAFGKYTMDGDLVEQFNLGNDFNASCLSYDGNSFYCTKYPGLKVLFQIDLNNKTIIDSTTIASSFWDITYDPGYDGFWLGVNDRTTLYDRQGHKIMASPLTQGFYYGSGYFAAKDGKPHLLLSMEAGVFDYDINDNVICDVPLMEPGWDYTYGTGAFIGKYEGKDAMFISIDHAIRIYEIGNTLAQIANYRIYRANSEGDTVMLADLVAGSDYVDNTWNEAPAGMYRFGISMVYANGIESEIIWTEFVEKNDYGVGEIPNDPKNSSVQKVFENGQIIIIKDGKRYNVSGQELN